MHPRRVGDGLRELTTGGLSIAGEATPAIDLTPFVPRLVPQWVAEEPEALHRATPGTLVFTDLSGFTAMSEQLAALGKVGAEELTQHLDTTFTELVAVSGGLGGTMLKFGGDALLLFFWGDGHEHRAAAAALQMQETLTRIGTISTGAGTFQLQMTVGAHCGDVDFLLVGSSHAELFVCGPVATETVEIEGSADPGEVRLSAELASRLPAESVEITDGHPRLVTAPDHGAVTTSWPVWPAGTTPNHFVPEMLRNHLISGIELQEHRQMVVGFLHLANIDQLLQEVRPDVTARHLADLVGHVQSVFAVHGIAFVSTDVYEGGPKIICAAGAVRTFGNDDESLLRALREIVDYPSPIDLRIGVNRGHGFCGYVGPPFRRTFVTIGDVVNTAARVMSKAARGEVLSTKAVLDRSGTRFDTTELPPFAAKGKSEPLVAFRVGAVIGTVEPDAQRSELPLIGRGEELATLLEAAADVRSGTGRYVEILGDTGIGKSRLVEELIARSGLPVQEARCGRYAGSTPFFPFRTLVAGLVGGDSVDALVGYVRKHHAKLEPYISLLALLIGHTAAHSPVVERLGPTEQRAKLHEVAVELLEAGERRSTIWFIDDAQWIDPASAELVRHLATHVSSTPLLICVARRLDENEALGSAGSLLELGPLDEDASCELLDVAAASRLLPRELQRLAERAHGNPYFLVELARVAGARRDFDHLPDSLEALTAARIDSLPPADRSVLRQLAVVGSRFDPDVAAEAVDALPDGRDPRWERLDEFIDRSGRVWRFRQTLVRDAAYEGLSYKRRREVHERAGSALERHADDPSLLCELLSLHFHSAGNHSKALAYSNEAAEKARRGYAFAETGTFLARSVDAARGLSDNESLGEALSALGQTELDLGQFEKAGARFEESLAIERERENALGEAWQLNGIGSVAQRMGEYAKAEEHYREALTVLRKIPGAQRVGAVLSNLGVVAWVQGKNKDAQAWFEEALKAREADDDLVGVASSHETLGSVAFATGDPATARARFEESLQIRRRLEDKRGIASSVSNLGNIAVQEGQYDLARTRFEEALRLEQDIGNRRGVANAFLNLGLVAHHEEQFDAAREQYQESLAILYELGDKNGAAQCLHNLGEAALEQGDLVTARSFCEDSLAIRREIGDRPGMAASLTTLGALAIDLDDLSGAKTLHAEALDLHNEVGNRFGLCECLEGVAAVCAAHGDDATAATLLGAADAILSTTGSSRYWSAAKRESLEDTLRSRLGETAFTNALHIGRSMSQERALEVAQGALAQSATTATETA